MSQATTPILDHVVQCYGDLLFDLCESVLWSPLSAQLACRSILKEIKKRAYTEKYHDFERAWVLRIACEKLREFSESVGQRLTPAEQIELDSHQSTPQRLEKFEHFFRRLGTEEQLLLLLRDKYGVPFPEIATAMGVPEESLKIRRSQALRSLEDWLWDPA